MGRRLLAAGAVLLLVAACGEDAATTPDVGSTATTASITSAGGSADWCDELESIQGPEDLGQVDVEGVPDEIREPLEELADSVDLDPESAPPDTVGRLVAAQAAVESWGHEHCGGDHPFCSVWITFNGTIAASAFTDPEEEGAVAAELESFVDQLDDVLTDYAPPEVREQIDTYLASLNAVFESSTMSVEDERAAEAAEDALDEWARSEGCSGA